MSLVGFRGRERGESFAWRFEHHEEEELGRL
jgi:hypothetical protein